MENSSTKLLKKVSDCKPCQIKKLSKQSDGFCTDCQEYMCQTCFQHHLKAKSCRNHVLDTLNNGSSDSGLEIREQMCNKHIKETIKYYCRRHDTVICVDCIISDHSNCELKSIKDIASNFKENPEFKNMQSEVQQWEANKTESEMCIERNRKENKSLLSNALQKLRNYRVEISVRLDTMEKNIETEARKIAADNDVILSEMEEKLKAVSNEIDMFKEKIETNLNHRELLFIHIKEYKPKICAMEAIMSDIKSNHLVRAFTFERENKVNDMLISSLKVGIIEVSREVNKGTGDESIDTGEKTGDESIDTVEKTGDESIDTVEKPCILAQQIESFDELEVPRESVKIIKTIGDGIFGEIYAGKWKNTIDVAVKKMREGIELTTDDLLAEAKLMHQLRHQNILQLIAVCTKSKPIWIITELMVNGNLLNYLRKSGRRLGFRQLTCIAKQIADGMVYLESMKCVHTDLRAASVFVGYHNKVKVARIGAARFVEKDCYEFIADTKVPFKWTAPEVIDNRKISFKSVVWAYGVLLYELITYGREPYQGMTHVEVKNRVAEGYRMPKPSNCPEPYYEIMMDCWRKGEAYRPTFEYLKCYFGDYEEGVVGGAGYCEGDS